MTSTFARLTTSDIIEVLAENGEQRFLVHRDILAAQSKPFQEATRGVWKETTQRKIDLGDWDGDTVGRLVEFVYTGNYSYPDPEPILRQQVLVAADRDSRQQGPASQGTMQSNTPCDESQVCTNRPLTPLNEYIHSLPLQPDLKTDATRLEGLNPTQHDYQGALLSHARVYVLAHYKSIDALRTLALRRVLMTLSAMNPVQPGSHISSNIVHCVKYVYENTDCLTRSEEPLRRVISQFVALNLLALQTNGEFMYLMREGGDLICDVIPKVCRRLQYNENLLLETEPGFVSDIRVEYGDSLSDRPIHHIHVFGGDDDNICGDDNSSPMYVWLVPEYTAFAKAACTSFRYRTSTSIDNSKKDISRGGFRYIDSVKEQNITRKITMVALLRSRGNVTHIASSGYGHFDGMTTKMNKMNWNHTGEYLYVLWKSVQIS